MTTIWRSTHEPSWMKSPSDLDGLSQLRALMAWGCKPGILVALDFGFVEVKASKAVFAGTPGVHAYNPTGAVHGRLFENRNQVEHWVINYFRARAACFSLALRSPYAVHEIWSDRPNGLSHDPRNWNLRKANG